MVASLKQAFRASVAGVGRAIEWAGTKVQIIGLWIEGLVSLRGDKSQEKKASLDDELNRREFAHSLARYIANIDAESEGAKDRKSTTIGVYGEWGTGKTYLKNLVLRELEKMGAEVPFVEYNPWQWSAQQKLTESFFDSLEKKFRDLGATGKPGAEKYAKISERLRKLSLASTAFGPSPKTIAVLQTLLFGLIAYFLGTSNWNEWAWTYQVMAVTATLLGLGLWFVGQLAEKLASWMEINSSRAERSLKQVKEDLTELFADLDQPFLVVIDDIDRLTADQIRMMMQLIKANADFPNVVYLVLFEREIITGSLSDEESNIDGAKFLEKIVHLSFDLPRVWQKKLIEEFKKRLSSELESRDIPSSIVADVKENRRLATVVDDFLPDFISTLRNVNRVIPAFVFYLEHYIHQVNDSSGIDDEETEPSLEVNPGDLLALELLRIFDTEVHDRIPSRREILTNRDQTPLLESDIRDEVIGYLLSPVKENGSKKRIKRVRDTLGFLFRHLNESAEVVLGVENNEYRRRVSHPETFDRYFERRIPEDALRKSQISALLDAAEAGKEGALQGFRNLVSQTNVRSVISALDAHADEMNVDQVESLLSVIFDEGDSLRTRPNKGFEMPESELALEYIQTLLRQQVSSKEQRATILRHALESTSGLYLPARAVDNAVRENQRRTEYREPLYSEDDLDEIVSLLGENIDNAARGGNLLEQRHVRSIFHIWHQHGFEKEALQWIEAECKKGTESFFKCLDAFNAASQSDRMLQSYHEPENEGAPFSLDGERLDQLGVLDILNDASTQLNFPADLTQRQHRMISVLRDVSEAFEEDSE